ncbi:hypothetical protein SGM_4254 [Streptomyces griseoaurantiacus M045]|uniref:Uncharacterized protein n=1 Tax=Streptomyces griseoaurantiacus M045 TaxID=996637 RepID=F3NLZ9_9ACTN|nr:hypothetical protein SGM_4254 [Streptomyces griseoaurantiacus M045]
MEGPGDAPGPFFPFFLAHRLSLRPSPARGPAPAPRPVGSSACGTEDDRRLVRSRASAGRSSHTKVCKCEGRAYVRVVASRCRRLPIV